jgi:hypothetical protein
MESTTTHFDTFETPEPLGLAGRSTISELLGPDEGQLTWFEDATRSYDHIHVSRTHIDNEPDPLRVPRAFQLPAVRPSVCLEDCLSDLQDWLGIGLDSAARITGINRGTVYAWRERHSQPRPATVGSILRVHGLVASAVTAVGANRARVWFHAGAPSPLDELGSAGANPAALSAVARKIRRELTAPPVPDPNPQLAATVDDLPPAARARLDG